ncbi:unnamed protein product [Prunus armeniaca]
MRDIIRHGIPTEGHHRLFLISLTKEQLALLQSKGQLKPFLISPTKEQLALLQSKGQLRLFLISPTKNQLPLLQSKGQLKGTTTGIGKGNGRGEMPMGKGNVGNETTEIPNNFSSSQPLSSSSHPISYTGATSSSSQPPKSLAKKLKPWML